MLAGPKAKLGLPDHSNTTNSLHIGHAGKEEGPDWPRQGTLNGFGERLLLSLPAVSSWIAAFN